MGVIYTASILLPSINSLDLSKRFLQYIATLLYQICGFKGPNMQNIARIKFFQYHLKMYKSNKSYKTHKIRELISCLLHMLFEGDGCGVVDHLFRVIPGKVIKYKLNMAEAGFYMNDDESMGHYDAPMDSDWFEDYQSKGNSIVMPHITIEVPEMFAFKSCMSEPIKIDHTSLAPTDDGRYHEMTRNLHQPISSEIEFPSNQLEENHDKPKETEEDFFPQTYTEPELLKPIFEEPRSYRKIQFSMEKFNRRATAERGKRFETKNLCKHVHTETVRHLKNWDTIYQFAKEEREQVKLFCHAKASIDNFKDLFKSANIALICREFYESPYFIKEILGSKMEMGSKLTIFKYLEKMRKLTHDPTFKAWKKDNI